MTFIETDLPGVMIVEPRVFADSRGWFMETFHAGRFRDAGLPVDFVQDNASLSEQGVLRGLHYQIAQPQAKLVRVVRGEVFDVSVDLRRSSPHFGRWTGVILSETNRRQLVIPAGFAHGFCVLSAIAEVTYKCTALYAPQYECTLLWNDPALGIAWPIREPILSPKDRAGLRLADARAFE